MNGCVKAECYVKPYKESMKRSLLIFTGFVIICLIIPFLIFILFLIFNTGNNHISFDLAHQEIVSNSSIERISIEDDGHISFLERKPNVQRQSKIRISELDTYFSVIDGRNDLLPLMKNKNYLITNNSHLDATSCSIIIHIDKNGIVDWTSKSERDNE